MGTILVKTKRCSRCGQYKELSEFNMQSAERKHRRQPYCRQCQHEYAHENYSPCGRALSEVEESTSEQRNAYNELYLMYKQYKDAYTRYISSYGNDGVKERMSFEYNMGF